MRETSPIPDVGRCRRLVPPSDVTAPAHEGANRQGRTGGAPAARSDAGVSREPHEFPPDDDPIEVWGRRIGRGLAVVAGLALAYYLFTIYLR